jgi:hypothetical protein
MTTYWDSSEVFDSSGTLALQVGTDDKVYVHPAPHQKGPVADCGEDLPEEDYQDWVNLIAAAPTLLAACREALEFLDNGTPIRQGSCVHDSLRAALAMAFTTL